MTPREKRDRLFKSGRPKVRPLQVREGAAYSKDMGILWVAHQNDPFLNFSIDKENFLREVEELSVTLSLYVVEDTNTEYKDKGPVAFVYVYNNEWEIQPHVEFFPWATARNKLKSTVAFLQMVRYSRAIGVCVIQCAIKSIALFDKVKEYGVLHYVGKILNGYSFGDKFIYSVKGKRKKDGSRV